MPKLLKMVTNKFAIINMENKNENGTGENYRTRDYFMQVVCNVHKDSSTDVALRSKSH